MKFSHTSPSAPGHYWLKTPWIAQEIIKVRFSHESMGKERFVYVQHGIEGEWPVEEENNLYHWSEKIPEPEEA